MASLRRLSAPKPHENVFNTPTGKVEVYSETLEKAGFAGLPTWEEPPAPKPGQFYLLTGKGARQTQFATQNNQLLHKYDDEPGLWMNAKTAASQGLKDGDLVEVTSEVGKIYVKLIATEAIRPDCVFMIAGLRAYLQGPHDRLRSRGQRFGPARHVHGSDQRRPGPQPDICNGEEGLKWEPA